MLRNEGLVPHRRHALIVLLSVFPLYADPKPIVHLHRSNDSCRRGSKMSTRSLQVCLFRSFVPILMLQCMILLILELILFNMTYASSVFFFSSRRRHTRLQGDWSSDVCSS